MKKGNSSSVSVSIRAYPWLLFCISVTKTGAYSSHSSDAALTAATAVGCGFCNRDSPMLHFLKKSENFQFDLL